jgi:single-strand DNA-binding protein
VAFSVADNYKKGQDKITQWFRCEAWNKQGDIVEQYAKKGHQILVIGQFIEEKYTDKEGVEKTSNKIRVDKVTLLSQMNSSGDQSAPQSQPGQPGHVNPSAALASDAPQALGAGDDLPF